MDGTRRRLPSLNSLRAFETAARTLNVRLAAAELSVTHGAVAQQLRALEQDLEVQLFIREPRGLTLTDAGRSLAADVSQAFDLLRSATARVTRQSEVVVISVPPTFAAKVLIPQLEEIQAALPGIELRTLATPDISDIGRDGVDLAVRMTSTIPRGLEGIRLFKHRLVAVASPRLVGDHALPLSDAQLRELPLIQDAHEYWPAFLPGCNDARIRFNQTTLALDAAMAGRGVALACSAYIARDVSAGRLVVVSDRSMDASPDFHLIRRQGGYIPAAVARFWAWAERSWVCDLQ